MQKVMKYVSAYTELGIGRPAPKTKRLAVRAASNWTHQLHGRGGMHATVTLRCRLLPLERAAATAVIAASPTEDSSAAAAAATAWGASSPAATLN